MNIKDANISNVALTAMLAILMSACSETFPLIYYNEDEDEPIEMTEQENTPVRLYIGPQTFFNTSRAGVGALDEHDGADRYKAMYRNMLLHTLAFRCTTDASGNHSYSPDYSKTLFNDERHNDCLVNSLTSGETGAVSRFVDEWPEGSTEKDLVYFYNSEDAQQPVDLHYNNKHNGELGYNFFSYYLDNAKVESTSVSQDRISHRITIDGTQDIMCGYAPPMNYQLLLDDYTDDNHKYLTDEERRIIASIGGYSAYAANRNVDPKVRLRHMLSRLRFQFYAGNSDCHNMKIHSITIVGKKTGVLTVAARDLNEIGLKAEADEGYFKVCEPAEDGTECLPMRTYPIEWNDADAGLDIVDRTPCTVNGSTMIIPDEEFKMFMRISQDISTTGIDGEHMKTETTDAGPYLVHAPKTEACKVAEDKYMFRPGATYNISIILYGMQDIQVTSNLSSWKYGGDISDDLNE